METISRHQELILRLDSISSPGDLLKFVLEHKVKKSNRSISYTSLAQKAGFKSRSYVRDIFENKRNLTEKALPTFASLLQLTATEIKLLSYLREVQSGSPQGEAKLSSLKSQLLKRKKTETVLAQEHTEITPLTFQIYAAVSSNTPRSAEEISRISGVSLNRCIKELRFMVKNHWLTLNQSLFLSSNQHIKINEDGKKTFLKSWFLSDLENAKKEASNQFERSDALFATYKFSVHQSELSTLSKRLRAVINEWAEESSPQDGDQVVTLTVSLC